MKIVSSVRWFGGHRQPQLALGTPFCSRVAFNAQRWQAKAVFFKRLITKTTHEKESTSSQTIIALSAAVGALAQVPSMINYQGRLRAGHGKPFNGLGQFKFALVNGGTNLTTGATTAAALGAANLGRRCPCW